MKAFRALLLLLALALAGALAWHALAADPGYVLVVWRGWQLESTVLVALAALLLGWLLLRMLLWLVRAPWIALQRGSRRRARLRLAEALVAREEGRWQRADALLQRAATHPDFLQAATLEAARALRARGEADEAERLLRGLDPSPLADLQRAEACLERGDSAAACERLDAAAAAYELPPRGWWLRVRAMLACGRADEALALLPELRRVRALPPDALEREEARLAATGLAQLPDYQSLRRARRRLPRALRRQPEVVAAYARRCAGFGLMDVAAKALESGLKHVWSEQLIALYGRLPLGEFGRRLRAAEGWLAAHPDNPALLLCLGRLCREDGLWGKAEDYLEGALKRGAGAEAWEEIGLVAAARGDDARARQALANALRVARGESTLALPAPRPSAAPSSDGVEERSDMGLPRLPARSGVRETEGET